LLDSRLNSESVDVLMAAREQYVICRGESSELVRRIDESLKELQLKTEVVADLYDDNTKLSSAKKHSDEAAQGDEDLQLLTNGWQRVLFEIKTFEHDSQLAVLCRSIMDHFCDETVVRWCVDFRLCDVGYGIQSLVMSCELNESIQTRNDFADEVCEAFSNEIQHVDILLALEYQ
jgi:hypothetical protein